jgi:hypothetical protein
MSNPTVFISAASVDLRDYRDLLHKLFSRAGFRVLTQDNSLGSAPQGVMELLSDHIRESDCVIHLAGLGYGSHAQNPFPDYPEFVCSWTQFEYYFAHSLGKDVIALVCAPSLSQSGFEETGSDEEREKKKSLQLAHRDRVASGKFQNTPLDSPDRRTSNETVNNLNELTIAIGAAVGTLKGKNPFYDQVKNDLQRISDDSNLAHLKTHELLETLIELTPDRADRTLPYKVKNAVEKHIKSLAKKSAGTILPLESEETPKLYGETLKNLFDWSIPRSIQRNTKSDSSDSNVFSLDTVLKRAMVGNGCYLSIIGEAGSGKTSYLRQIASSACKEWNWDQWVSSKNNQQMRLPVFLTWRKAIESIRLGVVGILKGSTEDVNGELEKLVDKFLMFVSKEVSGNDIIEDEIAQYLSEYGTVFILDALDETISTLVTRSGKNSIESTDVPELLRILKAFTDKLATRNAVVISSMRSSVLAHQTQHKQSLLGTGLKSIGQLETGEYKLCDWSISDARNYVDTVLGGINPEQAAEIKKLFIDNPSRKLGITSALETIWKDPFLLSVMVNLYLRQDYEAKPIINSVGDLFDEALKYLANPTKESDSSTLSITEKSLFVISSLVRDAFFESEALSLGEWYWREEEFNRDVSKNLRAFSKNGKEQAYTHDSQDEELYERIKSTGFFKWSKIVEGSKDIKVARLADYRILEYLFAYGLANSSGKKMKKQLDQLFDRGTHPMVFHYIGYFEHARAKVIEWVFEKTNSISTKSFTNAFMEPYYLNFIDTVQTRNLIQCVNHLYSNKVYHSISQLEQANAAMQRKSLSGIISKIKNANTVLKYYSTNRVLLKSICHHLENPEALIDPSLLSRHQIVLDDSNRPVWGDGPEKIRTRPLFDQLVLVFWEINPILLAKTPYRLFQKVDTDSCVKNSFLEGSYKQKIVADSANSSHEYANLTITGESFVIISGDLERGFPGRLQQNIIAEYFGPNEISFRSNAKPLRFRETIFFAMNSKVSALLHSQSTDIHMRIYYSYFLVVFCSLATGFLLMGVSEFVDFSKSNKVSIFFLLVAVLLAISHRMFRNRFFIPLPEDFYGALLPTELLGRRSKNSILKLSDCIFDLVGLRSFAYSLKSDIEPASLAGHSVDYWLLNRALTPFSGDDFLSEGFNKKEVANFSWSDDSLELLAERVSFCVQTCGYLMPPLLRLSNAIFLSESGIRYADILSKMLGVSTIELSQYGSQYIHRNSRLIDEMCSKALYYSDDWLLARKFKDVQVNEALWTQCIQSAMSSFESLDLFYHLCTGNDNSAFGLWLSKNKSLASNHLDGIIRSFTKELCKQRANRDYRYNISNLSSIVLSCFSYLNPDTVAEFCIECCRSGNWRLYPVFGNSVELLELIRLLPLDVRIKYSGQFLDGFSDFLFFDWFGVNEAQRLLFLHEACGRPIAFYSTTLYRFLRLFRPIVSILLELKFFIYSWFRSENRR